MSVDAAMLLLVGSAWGACVWTASGLMPSDARRWLLALCSKAIACGKRAASVKSGTKSEKTSLSDASEMTDIVRLGLLAGLSFDAALEMYCANKPGLLSRSLGSRPHVLADGYGFARGCPCRGRPGDACASARIVCRGGWTGACLGAPPLPIRSLARESRAKRPQGRCRAPDRARSRQAACAHGNADIACFVAVYIGSAACCERNDLRRKEMGHWFENTKQRLYFLVQKAASTVRIVANEQSAQGTNGVRHSCWQYWW